MKKLHFSVAFVLTLGLILSNSFAKAQNVFYVDASTTYVLSTDFSPTPVGGDIIKIESDRSKNLKFVGFEGEENNPIIFINDGGQVLIKTREWGALRFADCKHIKVSGTGDQNVHYGFKLIGAESGLSFENLSSDCEAEFIEIEGARDTFFGIYAKKDFSGNPPEPYPIFNNLSIHDTYIHDVAEGMYIGETTSPGMEFRHMRIYNNVVDKTLRESVQIANSVEDIEIYNNIFLNSGLDNLDYQSNGLQIGDNSIANVYNNIIIDSPDYGIIVLGNGDINLKNNFLQNSKGVFMDDRFAIIPYSPIRIEDNFFDEIDNEQVIKNMNEHNDLFILNNSYGTDITFFENAVTSLGLLEVTNNQFLTINDFQYEIGDGIFLNSSNNPVAYQAMGPQSGLGHVFNETPVLEPIDDIIITHSESHIIPINASVSDLDILHFEGRDLPSFLQINEIASGDAELFLNASSLDVGEYEIVILVYDESHQAYARQAVQLSVTGEPAVNLPPEIQAIDPIVLDENQVLDIPISILDDAFESCNTLSLTASNAPDFLSIIENEGEFSIKLQPDFEDSDIFENISLFASDGCLDHTISISVTVENTNRLPVFESVENIVLQAGNNLEINITATDADNDLISLHIQDAPDFVLLTDLGNGAGSLYLNPLSTDVGSSTFEINADDGHGEIVSTSINVQILDASTVNLAPVIQALDPIVLNENQVLDIPISILDDAFISCNSLSLTAINAPEFLSITQNIEGDFLLNLQPDFDDSGLYNIELTASDGCLDHTISISVTVENTNRLPIFDNIDDIEMEAGELLSIEIIATDADSDNISLFIQDAPDFVQLSDLGDGTGTLAFSPSLTDAGNFTIEIIAVDAHEGSSYLLINAQITAATTTERIVLNTAMITDLVDGGSRYSPIYLVDEQNLDPFLNEHPKSKSWLPSKYVADSPFHTIIDLGEEYFIDYAFLHDMHYTADLNISAGSPDSWTEIAVYNTSLFKQWNEVSLNTTSRYLLLSMYSTIYAQINEIALYGYAINQTDKSNMILNEDGSINYIIYPNPAKERIQVQNKTEQQTIEILNINGKVLLRTIDNSVDIANLPNGIYLLRLYFYEEVIFQDRFIKND